VNRGSTYVAAALALLAYFPARFIWDISLEHTRGLWSGVAFLALVAAAIAVVVTDTKDPTP
jgi:hypothetical protein